MSIHFFIHNGVCRLRRLLGLGPANWTRCDSERSSRRVVETSGSVESTWTRTNISVNSAMNSITRTFNAYCSEHGVQCTVTMDPSDYKQIFLFKNVSDCLVQITHQGVVRQIAPGEHVIMKVDDVLNPLGVDDLYKLTQWSLPQIETIHGALS